MHKPGPQAAVSMGLKAASESVPGQTINSSGMQEGRTLWFLAAMVFPSWMPLLSSPSADLACCRGTRQLFGNSRKMTYPALKIWVLKMY